jgi:hypothetical protein
MINEVKKSRFFRLHFKHSQLPAHIVANFSHPTSIFSCHFPPSPQPEFHASLAQQTFKIDISNLTLIKFSKSHYRSHSKQRFFRQLKKRNFAIKIGLHHCGNAKKRPQSIAIRTEGKLIRLYLSVVSDNCERKKR